MATNLITSETQRQLQPHAYADGALLSRDLPKDTCLKHILVRLSGSIVTTFASGTPVADAQSTMDNLVSSISVVVDGSRTVKAVRPHLLHMQQLLTKGIQATRRCSAGAAAANGNLPLADAAFTYGTTTQYTTVAETVLLSFENPWATVAKEGTWLNLKRATSAEIKIQCTAASKLLGFGNTAPVVYSASTLTFDFFTIENSDVPPEVQFADYRQSTKEVTFSAETADSEVKINTGNRLQGIMFFVKDGAAGSATTATGKLATNLGLTKILLMANGQRIVKATTFQALQDENKAQMGVSAPFALSVSRLDGVAYLNLLSRGDPNTALDTRGYDNLQLFLTTNNAANVSYTNPVSVTLMTDEIVVPR